MHIRKRRIVAPLTSMAGAAGLILGSAAPSHPLRAQEAPRAARPAAKAPARSTAAPAQADAGVRKTARQDQAEAPPRAKVDPEMARKMDALLREWEAQSAIIKTLTVKYKRRDVSPLWNTDRVYEGEARLTSKSEAYLDFKEIVEGQAKPVFDERIVCDGKKVYQFKGPTRQIFVFPLPPDQQQKALQQGPLPFLFNMRVSEAKRRYEMTLVAEDANSYTIKIIPLLAIDREEYAQALIKLGKNAQQKELNLLPLAIRLTSPSGKETKTFTFSPEGMIPNRAIPASWFDGAGMTASLSKLPPKQRWAVIDNPGADGQPQGAAAAPAVGVRNAPAGAAGRPAMKGQGGVRQK